MGKLRVNKGLIRLEVNDDGEHIEFSPDVLFMERFQNFYDELRVKEIEFMEREAQINQNKDLDENGIPINSRDRINLTKEFCEWSREKIDGLFGNETCRKVFGNVLMPELIAEFLEQVVPYITKTRSSVVSKYSKQSKGKKGVMK